MTAKKRNQIISFNRLLILALTIIGLTMDGFHGSDLIFSMASLIWLWMADLVRLEARWLQQSAAGSDQVESADHGKYVSPQVAHVST